MLFQSRIIEKEKSPWGDENSSLYANVLTIANRKREIPVRGRKPTSLESFHVFRIYRKREIPVRGRKRLNPSRFITSASIEKEKSPWGDEIRYPRESVSQSSLHRKREIPVRGRKPPRWPPPSPFLTDRKREIPVRGRKHLLWGEYWVFFGIEKEKSPWGDENTRKPMQRLKCMVLEYK